MIWNKLEEKYISMDEWEEQGLSNEEYLNNSRTRSNLSSAYHSQNWHVSLAPEYPQCMHKLIQNLTFLDFKSEEDTISVHEELIIDSSEFFETLNETLSELWNFKQTNDRTKANYIHSEWSNNIRKDHSYEEKMLWGKILWLIETALNATYSRSINDKRNYNQKAFVDSSQALFKTNKELIIDNLVLNDIMIYFLLDKENDKHLAIEYYSSKDSKSLYDSASSIKRVQNSKNSDKSEIWKWISEFRSDLLMMIRPGNDHLNGYEITKTQEQLYNILNETILYKHK